MCNTPHKSKVLIYCVKDNMKNIFNFIINNNHHQPSGEEYIRTNQKYETATVQETINRWMLQSEYLVNLIVSYSSDMYSAVGWEKKD